MYSPLNSFAFFSLKTILRGDFFMHKDLIYNADIYVRISRDDGDKEESDSIANQRALIQNYLKTKPEFKLHKIRVDDGYTGVNFDRPAFTEMLDDIKSGKVNCVIVKDLSRFGRNYIENGKYITNIFPFLGVRFIAINDNFDTGGSINSSELTVFHFKNILNDAYCNDISIKVRSQLDIKRKNGDFIGSYAPYGYLKAPENKNMLIIDESVTDIIRNIFDWKLSGMSSLRIAGKLNELCIASPMEHKKELGIKFGTGFRKKIKSEWTARAVSRILSNKVYIGTLEQGKTTTPNYKIKTRVNRNCEDWFVCENHHQAIIDKDVFEKVQTLLCEDTRVAPDNDEVYMFSGIVKCGKCGSNLTRKSCISRNGKSHYYYYICLSNKNKMGCDNKMCFPVTKLEQIVLESLNTHIKNFIEVKRLADSVPAMSFKTIETKKLDVEKDNLTEALKTSERHSLELYEDFKSSLISEKEYKAIKEVYTERQEQITTRLNALNKRYKLLTSHNCSLSIYDKFDGENGIKELTRQLLLSLIDKILIYDKNTIEIKFKYQFEYDLMLEHIKYAEVM